jgi:hypothetical protein
VLGFIDRETGLIGQLPYLEAEATGRRATGVGCYSDDPMLRVPGLPDSAFQDLYHFTVGGTRSTMSGSPLCRPMRTE